MATYVANRRSRIRWGRRSGRRSRRCRCGMCGCDVPVPVGGWAGDGGGSGRAPASGLRVIPAFGLRGPGCSAWPCCEGLESAGEPLVLLVAPSGFGKTSLLAEWAATTDVRGRRAVL